MNAEELKLIEKLAKKEQWQVEKIEEIPIEPQEPTTMPEDTPTWFRERIMTYQTNVYNQLSEKANRGEKTIVIKGKKRYGKTMGDFEASLEGATINAVDWTSPEIWDLCNGFDDESKKMMKQEGNYDWSCIRDSTPDNLDKMYAVAKQKLLKNND